MADIVAKLDGGELAMVFEYVDDKPGPELARWWIEHAPARVIVLEWKQVPHRNDPRSTRRMFLGERSARDLDVESSKRWDLPSPGEFEVLLPHPPVPEHSPHDSEPRAPGYHGYLGRYTPSTGRIVLAGPTIESVASSLGLA